MHPNYLLDLHAVLAVRKTHGTFIIPLYQTQRQVEKQQEIKKNSVPSR